MFADNQDSQSVHKNETPNKVSNCKTHDMECGVNSPYYQMQSNYLRNNMGLIPRPCPAFPGLYSDGDVIPSVGHQQSPGKSNKAYMSDTLHGVTPNMAGTFEGCSSTPMLDNSLEKADVSERENRSVVPRSKTLKHLKNNKNEKTCEICGDLVPSGPEKSINMLKCATCFKLFKQMRSFYDSVSTKRTTKEKSFSCEICDKSYISSATLKNHMIVHSGEKSLQCPCCDKKFFYEGNLKTHLRTHTGEKPFKCDTCGKSFSQSGSLKKHIRVHTGEKPFKCEFCDKTFAYSENLIPHRRTHSGEKPFHCHLCEKSFTQPGSLRVHLRSHSADPSRPGTSNTENLLSESSTVEPSLLL